MLIQRLYLHPNMYLLIPGVKRMDSADNSFTSQHVSINSGNELTGSGTVTKFTSQHVSINSEVAAVRRSPNGIFTSQHVSINSN